MMVGSILSLISGLLKLINKFLPSRDELAGKAKAERDALKGALDAVEKARKAHRLVRSDPDYRSGVRDRFRDG